VQTETVRTAAISSPRKAPLAALRSADARESQVVCQNSQGAEIRANLLRLTRHAVVFEVYNCDLALRMSEVLEDFKVSVEGRDVYDGRAVISNLLSTGTALVCEARLDDASLTLPPFCSTGNGEPSLRDHFAEFANRWRRFHQVRPEFKDVLGDMQTFLSDLRIWLDQVEIDIRSCPSGDRMDRERKAIDELAEPVVAGINSFIERFETIAASLEEELHPVHRAYLRRQLHPLVLCSPFAYRTFHKPLGYAGDYEVVNMMMRPPYEGSTLFAKMINFWLLSQAPVLAHRNRVAYLTRKLTEEALNARAHGRVCRVYNLGCGPAAEIHQFLAQPVLGECLQFTLADFNEETLAHVRTALEGAKRTHGCSTRIDYLKRSVQQVIKEAGRGLSPASESRFDFIYCAGLFDYLSDPVCKRLTGILYDLLAPGGLLVTTNVSDAMNRSHPFRHSMEYILDWHLIYRNGPGLSALAPERGFEEGGRLVAEDTGVNVFIEIRKPGHE